METAEPAFPFVPAGPRAAAILPQLRAGDPTAGAVLAMWGCHTESTMPPQEKLLL